MKKVNHLYTEGNLIIYFNKQAKQKKLIDQKQNYLDPIIQFFYLRYIIRIIRMTDNVISVPT